MMQVPLFSSLVPLAPNVIPVTTRTFFFNGIDGVTGQYILPPQPLQAVVDAARHDRVDTERQQHLLAASEKAGARLRGLPLGKDERKVEQVGWGIVMHRDEPADVRASLRRLIEHRAKTVEAKLLKELTYEPGESPVEWLARYGTTPGNIRPIKVPLYLLVIGPPERIAFSFTQDLDAEYAVGRLCFDTAEEYRNYVTSLIQYESAPRVRNTKNAVFFGTRHNFDGATQLSADNLVCPLVGAPVEDEDQTVCERAGFHATTAIGDGKPDVCTQAGSPGAVVSSPATRTFLLDVLRGRGPAEAGKPSFLFTATHGVGFPLDHKDQHAAQGALLCQEWPGLGEIKPAHYLAAADVLNDAQLSGLVAMFFACYSAGTPRFDRFWRGEQREAPRIAASPFMSALPARLLGHPAGGALACIGHVERAWGNSIADVDAGPQVQAWQNLVGRVLGGEPLGLALKDVNDRYAIRSVALVALLDTEPQTATAESFRVAEAWLDRNDAGGFVLLGDPAVRLRVEALS